MHLLAYIQAAEPASSGMSNIQIAAIVIAVVAIVGLVISLAKRGANYKGYEEYASEIDRISKTLRAETFRDGDDLVLSGNHKKYPIQVRFSYSETTPGLNLRMQAPVSFTFSVVPKGERATEGRVLVRTGDDMFDARFAARTDHPTQAKMIVSSKSMRTNLEKLCCSSKTFVTLTRGAIEVSELVIPEPYTARHVLDHLDSMAVVAKGCEDIPGAESVKIVPYEREKSSPTAKIAIAVGIVAAMIAIFVISPSGNANLRDYAGAPVPEGIFPVDIQNIPDVGGYRGARAEEFDGAVASWMRGNGIQPEPRMEMKLGTAQGEVQDVGYWLVKQMPNDTIIHRLILLRNGKPMMDMKYNDVVGAVRVPASSLQNVEWAVRPGALPNGETDGLLVFRRQKRGEEIVTQPALFFQHGERMIQGTPRNYESISLQ